MKHVKMLGLAAVAAMAFMAFLGASSASATVLCSTTVEPCPSGQSWPVGTEIEFSLVPGSSASLNSTAGETIDTCTGSKVGGKIENAGSSTATVSGKIATLDWESCKFPTTTTVTGKLEIHKITGTSNGTVTGIGQVVTINTVLFGTCTYGTGTGTDLGTLTEGNPAHFDANAIVNRESGSGFACPETAKWVAEYVVTKPSGTTLSVGNS